MINPNRNIYCIIFSVILAIIFSGCIGKASEKVVSPKIIIVKPNQCKQQESNAVERLARLLNQALIDTVIVRSENEPFIQKETTLIIAVGETKYRADSVLSKLDTYGFCLAKHKNVISIYGKNATGTLLGINYFLEHYCDIHIYMPSSLFTQIPSELTIDLANSFRVIQNPFTPCVMSTGFSRDFENEYFFAEMNGLIRKNWGSHEHTMGERFPPEKFLNKYPEIYPIYNGKRFVPKTKKDQRWQPNFDEPSLVDAAVESSIDYFKKNPGITYLAFSVQDGGGFLDEGEEQEFNSTDEQRRRYTDMYVKFLNELAKRLEIELPQNGINDKRTIVYLSYSKVKLIPQQKLHPWILPITVFRIAESKILHLYDSLGNNGLYKPHEWAKVTHRIGQHDWAQGNGYLYPRIYTSLWQEYLKNVQKEKLKFEYAHLECYPNWGLDGPKYYYLGKLLWNPTIDMDSLQKKFCDDMFGKSNEAMQNYFRTLEELTISMNNKAERKKMWKVPEQLYLDEHEQELIRRARNYLNTAKLKTQDRTIQKRIDVFSKSFQFSEYLFEIANSKVYDKAKVNDFKGFVRNVILDDPLTLYLARSKNKGSDNKLMKTIDQLINSKNSSKGALK